MYRDAPQSRARYANTFLLRYVCMYHTYVCVVCMHECMCVFMFVGMYRDALQSRARYTNASLLRYLCMYVCMYVLCVCCVSAQVCIYHTYVCVCCMHACMHMYVCLYACTGMPLNRESAAQMLFSSGKCMIHMYVCVCMHAYMCVYVCMYVCLYVQGCPPIESALRKCVSPQVCMYVSYVCMCMCVCMHVYVCVCVCVCIRIRTYMYTYTYVYICVSIRIRIRIRVYIYVCMYKDAPQSRAHCAKAFLLGKYMHDTYVCACLFVCMHVCIYCLYVCTLMFFH
jgi:hypothetical protein